MAVAGDSQGGEGGDTAESARGDEARDCRRGARARHENALKAISNVVKAARSGRPPGC